MTRNPRPTWRAEPLRARVLRAADTLFASAGASRTSMEAVASLAGTRKMSVYRLYASKAELVCAWLDLRLAAEADLWAHRRPLGAAGARRRLVALLRLARATPLDKRLGLAQVDDLETLGPAVAARLQTRLDLHLSRLEAFCREAGAADPLLAAWTLACFLHAGGTGRGLVPPGLDPRRLADLALAAGRAPAAPPVFV